MSFKKFSLMSAVLALFVLAFALPASAQQVNEPTPTYLTNTVTVSGSGQASGAPDVAYVSLGVDVADADISKAVNQANEATQAIIDAVQGAGVDAKDIQTSNFNMYPEDKTDPQTGASIGRVYHIQNTLNITVRDVTKASDVITAGINAGANTINSLTFGIADTTALETQARADAMQEAQRRAGELASGLGVTLGKPVVIVETEGNNGPTPIPYAANQMAFASADVSSVPVSQGQLMVTVNVVVTFSISS